MAGYTELMEAENLMELAVWCYVSIIVDKLVPTPATLTTITDQV